LVAVFGGAHRRGYNRAMTIGPPRGAFFHPLAKCQREQVGIQYRTTQAN
jgi:hypothetical protein